MANNMCFSTRCRMCHQNRLSACGMGYWRCLLLEDARRRPGHSISCSFRRKPTASAFASRTTEALPQVKSRLEMLYYLEAAVMRRRWRRAASLGESLFVIRSSPSAAHHGTMLTLGDMKRYQRRDGKKIYSRVTGTSLYICG